MHTAYQLHKLKYVRVPKHKKIYETESVPKFHKIMINTWKKVMENKNINYEDDVRLRVNLYSYSIAYTSGISLTFLFSFSTSMFFPWQVKTWHFHTGYTIINNNNTSNNTKKMYNPYYIHSICAYNKYFYDYTTAFRCTHRLPINTTRLDYPSPFTVYVRFQNEINTFIMHLSKNNFKKQIP